MHIAVHIEIATRQAKECELEDARQMHQQQLFDVCFDDANLLAEKDKVHGGYTHVHTHANTGTAGTQGTAVAQAEAEQRSVNIAVIYAFAHLDAHAMRMCIQMPIALGV